MKEEKIKIELINRLFEVFNADRIKNEKVIWYTLIEVKINRYKKQINTTVMDLNSTDIFLGYNWLVRYNLEVNWNTEIT